MRQSTANLVQRWKDEGPVNLAALTQWRSDDEWPENSWLPHAEEAFAQNQNTLLEILVAELTDAQLATLNLTKLRFDGKVDELPEALENAWAAASNPESRDLILEGRIRMERGLVKFETGDLDTARDDLTWAEARLKSVAKASREHDLSLLNKAAFHLMIGEDLMALQVYGDIPRNGEHAPETVAFSRLGASRILANHGDVPAAIRHSWVSFNLSRQQNMNDIMLQAGSTFLMLASDSMYDNAVPMEKQIEDAKPRSTDQPAGEPSVLPIEVSDVFKTCVESWDGDVSGQDRGDLLGLLFAGHMLGRVGEIEGMMSKPDEVEDMMLVAAVLQVIDPEKVEAWQNRLNQLAKITE